MLSPQVPSGLFQTVTPPALVSQPGTQEASTPLSRPHVENPLVKAGLILGYLADILSPQTGIPTDKRYQRITGVTVLTSNEYTEMVRKKDRKEREAAKNKQKRKKKENGRGMKKNWKREEEERT